MIDLDVTRSLTAIYGPAQQERIEPLRDVPDTPVIDPVAEQAPGALDQDAAVVHFDKSYFTSEQDSVDQNEATVSDELDAEDLSLAEVSVNTDGLLEEDEEDVVAALALEIAERKGGRIDIYA